MQRKRNIIIRPHKRRTTKGTIDVVRYTRQIPEQTSPAFTRYLMSLPTRL